MNRKTPLKLKRIKSRGPLADTAYHILKEAILQGEFPAGAWLQEEMLTQIIGISRTPLREAFNRLKGDGLIDVIPRKGARIIELSDEQVDDLFEVREVLEVTYFVRAARRVPREEFVRLRDSLLEAEREMDLAAHDRELWEEKRKRYLELDRVFHDLLIISTGNTFWPQLYFNIRDRIEIYGHQVSHSVNRFRIAIEDHKAILNALVDGEFEKGRDLMQNHIRKVRDSVRYTSPPSADRAPFPGLREQD